MKETHLYQQIAEHIRQQILAGEIKPGERLPAIRELTTVWNCTPGTIQRAYQALVHEGLVTSRVGQGTRVTERQGGGLTDAALRQTQLVRRAETFLLETIHAGYSVAEIERGVNLALDHWRQAVQESQAAAENTLRFAGSHDLMVSWISAHMEEIIPGWRLEISFSGSLGGLMALATGKADLTGCHLWDAESEDYNTAYVRRLLPGRRTALITLAERRQGLIVQPGNPKHIQVLTDLTAGDVRFVNRQSGSGTRVWLDTMLRQQAINPARIRGYENILVTHSEVARQVAEGQADVGLGFEGVAHAFALDFISLTLERYELVTVEALFSHPAIQALTAWLGSEAGKGKISNLVGYDTAQSGSVRWIG